MQHDLNDGWTYLGLHSVKFLRLANGKDGLANWYLSSIDGNPILWPCYIGEQSNWTILSKEMNGYTYFCFRDSNGNLLHDGDGQRKNRDSLSTYCTLNSSINLNFVWRIVHKQGYTEILQSDSNDSLTVHKYYDKDKYKRYNYQDHGYRVISHSDPIKGGCWWITKIE